MNELITKQFDSQNVRIINIDGRPWFLAHDVTKILGYKNGRKATSDHCKGVTKRDTLTGGGMQSMTYVNKSDLLRLIVRSTLKAAEKFESWIFDEVLPSILESGSYSIAPKLPATYKEALQHLIIKVEENEKLELELSEAKPAIEFHEAVANADKGQSFDEIARVLGIGRNKLYKKLRAEMILKKGNLAYQKYIDQGYFVTVEIAFKRCGANMEAIDATSTKTLVTGKGLQWIQKKFFGGQLAVA